MVEPEVMVEMVEMVEMAEADTGEEAMEAGGGLEEEALEPFWEAMAEPGEVLFMDTMAAVAEQDTFSLKFLPDLLGTEEAEEAVPVPIKMVKQAEMAVLLHQAEGEMAELMVEEGAEMAKL